MINRRSQIIVKTSAINAELTWSDASNPWCSMEVAWSLKVQDSPAWLEALSHAASVKHKIRSEIFVSCLLWLILLLAGCGCLTIYVSLCCCAWMHSLAVLSALDATSAYELSFFSFFWRIMSGSKEFNLFANLINV